MIPTIGIMIGLGIIAMLTEVITRTGDRAAGQVANVVAVIAILGQVLGIVSLLFAGS